MLKVRNVTIELMENSESFVIKTPPYGTRIKADGILTSSEFSDEEVYMGVPDKRKDFLEDYSYEEDKRKLKNILLNEVNITKLEKAHC